MDLYVSPGGKDEWKGISPDITKTDGPFLTVEKAVRAARRLRQNGAGAVTVWLDGGRYERSRPITLTPEDGGNITFCAMSGKEPVFDYSRPILGLREETVSGIRMWTALLPEVKSGEYSFNCLYANNVRRARPRFPKTGYLRMKAVDGFEINNDGFTNFQNGQQAFSYHADELPAMKHPCEADVIVHHYWIDERMPISEQDTDACRIASVCRSAFILRDDVVKDYALYYLENVFEALSEPGEWYLEREQGKLFYIPMDGETLGNTVLSAPVGCRFLEIAGRPEEGRYCENITFEGVVFRNGDYYHPMTMGKAILRYFNGSPVCAEKTVPLASAPQAAIHAPGCVSLRGARFCSFKKCRIENAGFYGMELGDGCTSVNIEHCEISGCGAGGIRISGSEDKTRTALHTSNNRVADNHIYNGGQVFAAGIGVLMMHSYGNLISHNHIHDFYYSGISCGWRWGFGESVSGENVIEYNHIHDLGKGLLSDMGGIYMLGRQAGTILRGNHIHDVNSRNYGGWGIYFDEGSSHIIAENNLAYRCSSEALHQHYGRENVVRNNILAFGGESAVRLSRHDATGDASNYEENLPFSFTLERNIIITDGKPLHNLGRRTPQEAHYLSDLNLYWDYSGNPVFAGGKTKEGEIKWTIEECRAGGMDEHSMIADPGFTNAPKADFTLSPDSPALRVGFKPFDAGLAGIRQEQE